MSLAGAISAAVLALSQAQTPPQPPADADDANTVEGVVVTGRRKLTEEERKKAVSRFVRELSAPTRRGRLARWDDRLCVGVAGLPQAHGSFIADRIGQETLAVGLEVGEPGCEPNVLILFTSRADQAAADLREKHRAFFTGGTGPGIDLVESGGGGQDLRDFLRTPRPVRWWHVARLAASDGGPLVGTEIPAGSGRFVPITVNGVSGRLASAVKEDLSRAVIIVDTTRTRGVTYEALASYLAMVSLAQLDPEAEPGSLETIMTLFADRDAGRAPPTTLTEWDRAYLRGLYASSDDARNLNSQRGAIRRQLAETASE